ncbi:MAG: methionyl-tRNA synthetase [Chlamydiae bacterium SM23_39]|nr:MAG: methionyl-tRNA synthetase [Chlamydiae bacterium SM23_39]
MKKILITSALPYANGSIHFGHIAGAYLPGDCYARFQRLKKNDVLYICGSDEYGIAITLSAELANRTPKEHVDIFHKKNLELFKKMDFSFDHYSRTTWEGHTKIVQEFFLDLCDNGYIEERTENHLYSEEEKKFLADRYVVGICPKCGFDKARGDECPKCGASYEAVDLKNPKSKLTNHPLVLKPSKHWYLRFDKFKERLKKWIETKKWKQNVLNYAFEYIKDLKPRAITRDLYWGVPLPIESAKDKVFYVWFDAPIGYISATKEWAEKNNKKEAWKDYWFDKETKLVQFIGKDNIPFHTVFFPAMLMGQNKPYILPDQIPANEFLLLEGRQFSKSDNWYIDLEDFFSKYSVDQIRFYLAANAPENSDSEFSWKDFQVKCNAQLLAKLGNFINRSLVFTKNYLNSKTGELKNLKEEDKKFLFEIDSLVQKIEEAYENFHVRKASQIIMQLADLGNCYFDKKKPWELKKDKKRFEEMSLTITLCLECCKSLALITYPIIPYASKEIWKMLGYKNKILNEGWEKIKNTHIPSNQKILDPKILFRKIEDKEIEEEVKNLYGNFEKIKKKIEIADFEKLDLRVGEIIEVENIKKSKNLIKLKVDLGFEKRTIVANIAKYYGKNLIGKKVIVLINLKPIKIMGIESQGMVLAGDKEGKVEIPFINTLPLGSNIR